MNKKFDGEKNVFLRFNPTAEVGKPFGPGWGNLLALRLGNPYGPGAILVGNTSGP